MLVLYCFVSVNVSLWLFWVIGVSSEDTSHLCKCFEDILYLFVVVWCLSLDVGPADLLGPLGLCLVDQFSDPTIHAGMLK